jgi:hypothetical protein
LSHQKPKASSSRQQHDSAKKEKPKSLPTLHGLESRAKIFASFQSPGSFSLDSPLYRTGGTIVLTNKWEEVTDKKDLQHYQKCFADRDRATAEKASAQEQSEPSSKNF